MENNKNFYRICLRHRVKFPLDEEFDRLWEDIVKPHCRQHGVTDERTMLYYLTFYQAGFTSLLRKWVLVLAIAVFMVIQSGKKLRQYRRMVL